MWLDWVSQFKVQISDCVVMGLRYLSQHTCYSHSSQLRKLIHLSSSKQQGTIATLSFLFSKFSFYMHSLMIIYRKKVHFFLQSVVSTFFSFFVIYTLQHGPSFFNHQWLNILCGALNRLDRFTSPTSFLIKIFFY